MKSKKQTLLLVLFTVILTSIVFLMFNPIINQNIKIKTYQDLKKYAEQGNSFDFVYDVTKEPKEEIMGGVLKYNGVITDLNIRDDSISSVSKRLSDNGEVVVKRTFYPNDDVIIDVDFLNSIGQETPKSFQRKGKLNKSVFLETTAPSKFKIPMS